jgi:hypothetical protein
MAKGNTTFGTPVFAKPEWGGLKKVYGKVTLVDNYETGGYDFALDTILNLGDVLFVGLPPTVLGYIPEANLTTDKLLFYMAGVGAGANIIDRKAVEAAKAAVAISQTAAEVFQYTVPENASLVSVRVYCTATAATASVDVKKQGTTVLTGTVTPVAGSDVAGTLTGGAAALTAADVLTVLVTTNGSGTITDLQVVLEIETLRAVSLAGGLTQLTDNSAVLAGQVVSFEVIHRGV